MNHQLLHRGLGLGRMVLLSAVLWGGCSGSEKLDSSGAFELDDGASEGAATAAWVGPDDDVTLSLKTGAQVSIPAGALDEKVEIGIKRPKDEEAKALVKTLKSTDKIASAPYVLTPHGTQFKKGVEVTLPIASGRDKEKILVAWLEDEDDKEWKALGKPMISGGKAKIAMTHFSVLVLLEREQADARDDLDSGTAPSVEPRPDAGNTGGGRTDAGTNGTDGRPDASPDVDQPDAGPMCEAPFELCAVDGVPSCVDTSADTQHCGGCGPDTAAGRAPDCYISGGFSCATGCTSGEDCTLLGECDQFGTGLTACEWAFAGGDVGIYCTDLQGSQFCGDCNTHCAPEETCLAGECVPRTCPTGQRPCGYFCRDENLSCGAVCEAGAACEGGECVGEATDTN